MLCATFLLLVARLGVGAKEVCPRTQGLEVENNGDGLGIVMLQVSKEPSVKKVIEMHEEAADIERMAALESRHAGNHHSHVQIDHQHHAKEKAQHNAKHNDGQDSPLQHTFQDSQDGQGPLSSTMGGCFSSEYLYVLLFFILLSIGFLVGLYYQYKTIAKLKAKVRGQRAKLRVDKYLIKADQKKLRAAKDDLKEEHQRLIAAIHDRGNVFFDPELRQIVLKTSIPFETVQKPQNMNMLGVMAWFEDPKQAFVVLLDVAEMCKILPFSCFLIEGHTLHGSALTEIDEFAHEVADSRALKVKETLMEFGVPADRLEALGLPGLLGNNSSDVVVKLID